MLDATMHALRLPRALPAHRQRPGKQRSARVAQVNLARKLTEAIWHMLTTNQPFDPAAAGGATSLCDRLTVLRIAPAAGLRCRLVLNEKAIDT
jgi:hypothetical protein